MGWDLWGFGWGVLLFVLGFGLVVAVVGLRGLVRRFLLLGDSDSKASVRSRERLTGVVSVVGVGLGGVDAGAVFWPLGVIAAG